MRDGARSIYRLGARPAVTWTTGVVERVGGLKRFTLGAGAAREAGAGLAACAERDDEGVGGCCDVVGLAPGMRRVLSPCTASAGGARCSVEKLTCDGTFGDRAGEADSLPGKLPAN